MAEPSFPLTFGSPNPDDLRAKGWVVAVHNDYRVSGIPYTFWLFTHRHSPRSIRGEGESDAEALDEVRREIERQAGEERRDAWTCCAHPGEPTDHVLPDGSVCAVGGRTVRAALADADESIRREIKKRDQAEAALALAIRERDTATASENERCARLVETQYRRDPDGLDAGMDPERVRRAVTDRCAATIRATRPSEPVRRDLSTGPGPSARSEQH